MHSAVVIGGGHAGLAASWYLGTRGVDHLVLEAGRVGESWRSGRWDSFAINTPGWSLCLPGDAAGPQPDDAFPLRDAWVEHLEGYARRHALPVKAGTRVTRLKRSDGDDGFDLETDGRGPMLCARSVIVASGFQRVGSVPAMAAALPPGVMSIHAGQYRGPDALPAGAVLVVGSAQSGGQIAEDLVGAGRTVLLSASAVPRSPRRYRGRDIFEWLAMSGMLDATPEQLPDPRSRFAKQPSLSGVGRYGHSISLQWLAGLGVRLFGRLVAIEGTTIGFAADLADSIRFADRVSGEMRQMVDEAIERAGRPAPDAEPDHADTPVIDPDRYQSPASLDLAQEGVGTVIWATGFGADLSWAELPILGSDGTPDQRQGRSVVPGIWFLGIPWMRTRKSALILGADDDARAVVDDLVAWLGLSIETGCQVPGQTAQAPITTGRPSAALS